MLITIAELSPFCTVAMLDRLFVPSINEKWWTIS